MRLLFLALALTACTQTQAPSDITATSHVVHVVLPRGISRELDLLFVIDSSSAMTPHQQHLIASYAGLMSVLETVPLGIPDVHIGVITTDAGQGGHLHRAAGLAAGQDFLSIERKLDGTLVENFTGSLGEVFTDMANVGSASSAPSQPFSTIRAALTSGANPGFLRDDAYLIVVMITAGDDASSGSAADLAAFLVSTKDAASEVVVAGAYGACDASGRSAAAAPRLDALLAEFPNRNTKVALCDDDLTPVLELTVGITKTPLGAPCVPEPLIDLDPVRPGTQPECAVWLTRPAEEELVLGRCADGHAPPCWDLVEDRNACIDAPRERFTFDPSWFPSGTIATLECLAP